MSVSSLKDAKMLGVVGSVMVLLTPIPTFGWVLGIAGLVLVLLAIRDISKVVSDKSIFENMVKAIVLAIGAIGVAAVTVAGVAYRVLGMGSFVGSTFVFPSSVTVADYFGLALIAIAGLVTIWAILTVSAIFVRRSYSAMAGKLNVKRFETAEKFYLIGAATSIIGVGLILVFIAGILQAISFFSIDENSQQWALVTQQAPVVS